MKRLSLEEAGGLLQLGDNVKYEGSPDPMVVFRLIRWTGELGPEQLVVVGNSEQGNTRALLVESNGGTTLLSPTPPEKNFTGGCKIQLFPEVTFESAGEFLNLNAEFVFWRRRGGALVGMEVQSMHKQVAREVWHSERAVDLEILR